MQDVLDAVAANAPVFFLHPRESYFPCTVEWFLQRAQLCIMRSIMLSRSVQRGASPRAGAANTLFETGDMSSCR